ncbi:MAG: DUF1801 domain-containing protein [Leptospiraceae bacterium]|nr:DUF1801 domain-containing protein [Leptospiraceae bacterium]
MKNKLNPAVTEFLQELDHPLHKEISTLRKTILATPIAMQENIKWNGPNYTFEGADRITMRIHPVKQLQLVFHRGAKVQKPLPQPLLQDTTGLLVWKENDRAIVNFTTLTQIKANKENIMALIEKWIQAVQSIK